MFSHPEPTFWLRPWCQSTFASPLDTNPGCAPVFTNGQRLQSNLKKYYTEWGKIHSILVLHKSIINEEEKNAK